MEETLIDILIVEDSPTQLLYLQQLLETENYKLAMTGNGKEALDFLSKAKTKLVISDVVMPEMNGYDLTRAIRKNNKLMHIPVLLLTSLSDSQDVLAALDCGASGFVSKPFDVRLLLLRIRQLISAGGSSSLFNTFTVEGICIPENCSYSTINQTRKFLLMAYEDANFKAMELQETNKTLQQALIRQQELVSVIENSNNLVAIISSNEKQLMYINQAGKDFLGGKDPLTEMDNRNLREKLFQSLIDSESKKSLETLFESIVCEENWSGKMIISRSAGKDDIPVMLNTFKIRTADGKLPIGIGLLASDITQLIRYEDELVQARNKAEKANQGKSDFLASTSHELRTPLTAIIGFSQLLKGKYGGELTKKQEEYVNDIYDSGEHLLSLINDILDISKIEAGEMTLDVSEVHAGNILRDGLLMIRDKAVKNNICLDQYFSEEIEDLVIKLDERKIRQVMYNLLSNAVKFTEEGGVVKIGARVDGEVLVISVFNTGKGIALEDQERIFEKFYQIKGGYTDKTPGTGLGLPIVKSLIDLHNGKIWIECEENDVGCTFFFTLPCVYAE